MSALMWIVGFGLLLIGWSASYAHIAMERFWSRSAGDAES